MHQSGLYFLQHYCRITISCLACSTSHTKVSAVQILIYGVTLRNTYTFGWDFIKLSYWGRINKHYSQLTRSLTWPRRDFRKSLTWKFGSQLHPHCNGYVKFSSYLCFDFCSRLHVAVQLKYLKSYWNYHNNIVLAGVGLPEIILHLIWLKSMWLTLKWTRSSCNWYVLGFR